MKFYKVILLAAFSMCIHIVNGQNDGARANPSPALKKAAMSKPMPTSMHEKAKVGGETDNFKSNIDENDPYQGREKEILKCLTVKEIPTDFPKYQKNYGIKYYNDLMTGYFLTHPQTTQQWVIDKLSYVPNKK